MDDDDLNSQEGGPAIPAGVLRTSKRGWAGEELEMEHRNEQSTKDDYAAVNIKQFQNTEVGVGYQSRGVVRQKTAPEALQNVRDMTAAKISDKTSKGGAINADSLERTQPKESKEKGTRNKQKKLDEYMSCDGIREFRKEIEQLLASASTSSRQKGA